MEGSIDPRCEKIRGTHWPKKGRWRVWNSYRGKPSWPAAHQPHQQAGHMDASDPIRPSKTLAARGPSTYGSRLSGRDDVEGISPVEQLPHDVVHRLAVLRWRWW